MRHPHLLVRGNLVGLFPNPVAVAEETGLNPNHLRDKLKDNPTFVGEGCIVIRLPEKGFLDITPPPDEEEPLDLATGLVGMSYVQYLGDRVQELEAKVLNS